MNRKLKTIAGTAGILIGGFVLIFGMGQLRPEIERREVEIPPPTVLYITAETASAKLKVSATGEVRPRTDINLTAQVAGRVIETADAFVDGGAFQKDDLLIKIEDTDYRARAASAKARVAQAEEALRLEQAEADLAERDFAELGFDDSPSELTLRLPQLAQARANFEAAQADYEFAMLNLARTEIRAPFEGRVRDRIAGVGQYVSPGAQLGRIFATDIAEIRLPLTDSDLAKLGLPIAFVESEDSAGPRVLLSAIVAGQERYWEGRIARTEGAIDPATRQIGAIAVVENPYVSTAADEPLVMGLFVTAEIDGRQVDAAVTLPRSVLYGQNEIYIIDKDDRLERREVYVASTTRDTVTLAGGVKNGERVAASPLRGAQPGDLIIPAARTSVEGADNDSAIANSGANRSGESL
ncbi:MAG: efflux RND transporter periplasmic adaptor subunit [Pseudomonadota bacterium]